MQHDAPHACLCVIVTFPESDPEDFPRIVGQVEVPDRAGALVWDSLGKVQAKRFFFRVPYFQAHTTSNVARGYEAMGQNPVPPVNIPVPTKIDYYGWCTYPKMVPLVLTRSHDVKWPA